VLLVYTGGGKGKTTAALGTLLRAWGHGMRVLAAFVMKTPYYMGEEVGEYKALRKLGVDVAYLSDFGSPLALVESVLEVADSYDLVILDEFNYAVRQGFIDPSYVKKLAALRPHVIITGNYLWPEAEEAADLISTIQPTKHYYSRQVAIKGLDW
jgi:cob(I)alamin adenosyltransferase